MDNFAGKIAVVDFVCTIRTAVIAIAIQLENLCMNFAIESSFMHYYLLCSTISVANIIYTITVVGLCMT